MIKAININKIYDNTKTQALKDISFNLPSTGLFYLLGHSGSGKTTLIEILAGIDRNFDGELIIDGKKIRKDSSALSNEFYRSTISVSFQSDELDLTKSVKQNIYLSLEKYNFSKKQKLSLIESTLIELGMLNKLEESAKKLSGGEKRRVSIARALIKPAKIYIFDEPFNGLEFSLRNSIYKIMKKLSLEALVIITTHQVDEIDPEVGKIILDQGKITEFTSSKTLVKTVKFNYIKTNRKHLKHDASEILQKFKSQRSRLVTAVTAISISLTCLGISILLSTSVKESIIAALGGSYENGVIAVSPRKSEILLDEKTGTSTDDLNYIKHKLDESVAGLGFQYFGNVEEMFPNRNDVHLQIGSKSISLPTFSLRAFLNYVLIKDLNEGIEKNFTKTSLLKEEVILGLPQSSIERIMSISDSKSSIELNKFLERGLLRLTLGLSNSSWSYHAEEIFIVTGIATTSKPMIIHSSDNFLTEFIEKDLKLKASYNLETSDLYPWTLKKTGYIRVKESLQEKFIHDFYFIANLPEYAINRYNYGIEDYSELVSDSRLVITRRTRKNFAPSYFRQVLSSEHQPDLVTISSELYVTSHFINGFNRAFFLAKNREDINKIIDNNYRTSYNLLDLSQSIIEVPPTVISGDVMANVHGKGFTLSSQKYKLKLGQYPKNHLGIVISSALAKSLGFSSEAIGKKIYFSLLKSSTFSNGIYINDFTDGYFIITGIVENENNLVVQDPLFLLTNSILNFDCDLGQNIDKIQLHYQFNDKELIAEKKYLQAQFPDLFFSCPSLEIKQEVGSTLNLITGILYAFSFFSLIITAFLLSYIIFLFFLEDRKNIGTKITLGFSIKDLQIGYLRLSLSISYLASLYASISLSLAQYAFKRSLRDLLGALKTEFTLIPFIIIWLISTVIGLLAAVGSNLTILNKDPKYFFKLDK